MKRINFLAAIFLIWGVCPASAAVVFDFLNNSELDGGTSMTRGGIVLTTTSVSYRDLSDVLNPGAIVAGGSTSISGSNGLGVNNPTVANGAFQTEFGPGDETNNFNFDETWTFSFDQEVTFDEVNFASIDSQDRFTVTIGGSSFSFVNGTANDDFSDPFAGLSIAANTDISFLFDPTDNSGSARISSFTVTAVAVPEPSSVVLLTGLGVVGSIFSRRRKNGMKLAACESL